MQFKQILKALSKTIKGKEKIRQVLFKYKHKLPEQDFWLLEYTYLEQLSIFNISTKFAIAESTYYQLLKIAIGKIEMLLSDSEFKEMFLLA